jgi:hypothetical protein
MYTLTARRVAAAGIAAVMTMASSGCGNDGNAADASDATRAEVASGSAGAADGDWLLRFTTAEGADGEQERAVYVRYNPTTGTAVARSLPTVTASDSSHDEQVLLVSADHARAIPDTGVPKAQGRSGKLVVYAVASESTETVDIRALTGRAGLRAVAWAFDPTDADVIRVVDADRVIWRVDLDADSATEEGTLPKREGWIFGNGFDKDTGVPYIESIDSDETEPAGNGDSDTRPVERQGGSLVRYDGEDLDGLPQPPCGFAGGFRFDDGAAWLFCADTPSIAAFALNQDADSWDAVGVPSAKVVPGVAAEMTFALPPVS